jgi:hypothetical protein
MACLLRGVGVETVKASGFRATEGRSCKTSGLKNICFPNFGPIRTPIALVIASDCEVFATRAVTSAINRYYDPSTDQFLSIDPDVAMTDQPYAFTNDSPLNAEDPLGLCGFTCAFKIAAGIVGSAVVDVVTAVIPGADETGFGEAADEWMDGEIFNELDGTASSDSESASESGSSEANCGGESFTSATDVQLANGTEVPIDDVKIGDLVLATNVTTGKVESEPVTRLWVSDDHDLMNLVVKTLTGESTVHTTEHHLFWDLTTHKWTEADLLGAGDQLETSNGVIASVVSEIDISGSANMWDLTVGSDHDFYVQLSDSTSAVLVHNCPDRGGSTAAGKSEPPSWFFNDGYNVPPAEGETPSEAATDVMNDRYGEGNWSKGTSSEFSKIQKYFARHY